MTYLLDTDWVVWWLRERPEVVERIKKLEPDVLAISIVTLAELYEGVESSKDPAAARRGLNGFLELVEVLSMTEDVAARFGTEATRLSRLGQSLPDFDLVIAATALHHDLALCTEDQHFERIRGLRVLRLSSA